MNKVKIVIKCLEAAMDIILLISTGTEIAGALRKPSGKSTTPKPIPHAV